MMQVEEVTLRQCQHMQAVIHDVGMCILNLICWRSVAVYEPSGTVPGCYIVGERANLQFRLGPDFPCRLVPRNFEHSFSTTPSLSGNVHLVQAAVLLSGMTVAV